MQERLLYIGKQTANRKAIDYLQEQGYEVVCSEGLRPSLRTLVEFDADAIVIDTNNASRLNMRRISHKAARKENNPFIILLTGNHSSIPQDAVHDDYLVRPFTPRRLEQKLRELLDSRGSYVVQLGPILLDRRTHRVKTHGDVRKLTPKQYELLDYLIEHPGVLITRRKLMEEIWETSYLGDTRTLDVHMRWLRECIEENPSKPTLIRTHRGRGYTLTLDGPAEIGGEPLV